MQNKKYLSNVDFIAFFVDKAKKKCYNKRKFCVKNKKRKIKKRRWM